MVRPGLLILLILSALPLIVPAAEPETWQEVLRQGAQGPRPSQRAATRIEEAFMTVLRRRHYTFAEDWDPAALAIWGDNDPEYLSFGSGYGEAGSPEWKAAFGQQAVLRNLFFRFDEKRERLLESFGLLRNEAEAMRALCASQRNEVTTENRQEGNAVDLAGFPGNEAVGFARRSHRRDQWVAGDGIRLHVSYQLGRVDSNFPAGDSRSYSEYYLVVSLQAVGEQVGFACQIVSEVKWYADGRGTVKDRRAVPEYDPATVHQGAVAALAHELARLALSADAALARPFAQPLWPDETLDGLSYCRLEVEAQPDDLRPQQEGPVAIQVSLSHRPGEPGAPTEPIGGAVLSAAIAHPQHAALGTIIPQATTDSQGRALLEYRPPPRDKMPAEVDRVAITVGCPALELEETVYVDFLAANGRVFMSPHFGATVSKQAVIPADPRFPASLEVVIEDDGMRGLPAAPVTIAIAGDTPRGLLRLPDGSEGISLTAATDGEGRVRAEYRYTGPADLAEPWLETLTITSPQLSRPLTATVSVGLDLAIAGLDHRVAPGSEVNAGDEVPLLITVRDAFRPEARHLGRVLGHWGAGTSSDSLSLQLDIVSAGVSAQYFYERLALGNYDNPPVSTRVQLKDLEDGRSALWLPSESLVAGWPRVRPLFSGANSYCATVGLLAGPSAEPEAAQALPERWRSNNRALFTLPAGLPANEFLIFYLEDPFGEHTREARVFRQVLKLMGGGAILDCSEIATHVGKGDFAKVGEALALAGCDKLLELAGEGAFDLDAVSQELLVRYLAMSEMQDTAGAYLAIGDELVGEELRDNFRNSLDSLLSGLGQRMAEQPALRSQSLMVLYGQGEQRLRVRSLDGTPCPQPPAPVEGRITDSPDGTYSVLKQGRASVYTLPRELIAVPENVELTREYHASE
jgi:hypothetical protein